MSRSTIEPEKKQEAIRLRKEERLPTYIIAEKVGVNRRTCYKWLLPYPLTKGELKANNRPVRRSLVGKRYGRLLVTELIHVYVPDSNTPHVNSYKCVCDCGNVVIRPYGNIYSGNTKSCGCLKKEVHHTWSTSRRLPKAVTRLHEIGRYYRRNAKVYGRTWEISDEELSNLVSRPCTYCGVEAGENFLGLDRVDSLQGYHLKNVVPCCKICNQAKSTQTVQEFKAWVQRIHQHLRLGVNDGHP